MWRWPSSSSFSKLCTFSFTRARDEDEDVVVVVAPAGVDDAIFLRRWPRLSSKGGLCVLCVAMPTEDGEWRGREPELFH